MFHQKEDKFSTDLSKLKGIKKRILSIFIVKRKSKIKVNAIRGNEEITDLDKGGTVPCEIYKVCS